MEEDLGRSDEPPGAKPPRGKEQPKPEGGREPHSLRDLLLVVGVVLAGLQLIPAFLFPQSQWPLLALGMVGVGGGIYAFLQLAKASKEVRRPFIPALLVILVATGAAGWKVYTLRERVLELEQQLAEQGGAGPIGEYLARIVNAREGQWGGRFEAKYARPTLYLLNPRGTTDRTPIEMRDQILIWRTGTEGMSPLFSGVAGLVAEMETTAEPYEVKKVVAGMLNYVDHPLADADLLNKRAKEANENDIPPRVLVLGDPAAGKSTMLQRLELVQARRARGTQSEPVPVLVPLGGLGHASRDALMALIREQLGEAAEPVLTTRKVILMLDGLDETKDPAETAAAIGALADDPVWDRVIVAGRIHDYTQDLHGGKHALANYQFRTAIMYGSDQTAIEKQILTLGTADERATLLTTLANTRTRPTWMQFLRLPLNFELIAALMVEYESDVLPRGQAELVGRFVDRRFEHRGISPADAEHCLEILTTAATSMLRADPDSHSRSFSLEDCLDPDALDTHGQAARLERVKSRLAQIIETGLINKDSKQGYEFFHLNLRDYFVARGLRDLSQVDPARNNWREILIFRAGMKDGPKVVELVRERARNDTALNTLLAEVTASQKAATVAN